MDVFMFLILTLKVLYTITFITQNDQNVNNKSMHYQFFFENMFLSYPD